MAHLRGISWSGLMLAVLFIGAITAFGQSSSLSGTVLDPQGSAVAGATITVTNVATGAARVIVSSKDGAYQVPQLAPGTYRLRAEAKGFATIVVEDVQVLVSNPITLNISFKQFGAVTETVTVQGAEAPINTSDATIGNNFTAHQITQLPLEGRNVVSLLAAQPGVTFIGMTNAEGATTDYRNGSVNGGRSDQANVMLDGIDVNDQQTGQAFNSVLRVPLDSLQEFRVVTTNPNAESGRSSGAQISLVTKSGTNSFHGSAYEYHRNTITSSNEWFNNKAGRFEASDFAVLAGQAKVGDERVPRPKLIRNVFGGSFGGPIRKDRLFFFVNYEGRRDAREESVVRVVPSADLRDGTFTFLQYQPKQDDPTKPDLTKPLITAKLNAAGVTALDPRHLGPNPAVLALFKQYPLPNDNSVGDNLNTFGFRFNSPVHLRWNTYVARLDYNLTQDGKHTLFWRGNLQNDHDNSTQQFPGQPARFTNFNNTKGFAAGYNTTLRQNLVNVFHGGYTRQGLESAGSSPLSGSHLVSFRTFDDLIPATRSSIRITPTWNIADDLSWVKGAHSMQFGGNIRWIRNNRTNFNTSFHSAVINKAWLLSNAPLRPPRLADRAVEHDMAALLRLVTQVTARYNLDRDGNNFSTLPEGAAIKRHFAADEYEFYGQDSWRVKPNLTITYGLRYSLYSPPWETRGLQVSPNVPLGNWFNQRGVQMQQGIPDNKSAPLVSFVPSGPENGAKGFYDWNTKNFAPRFAFAYSPRFSNSFLKKITGGEGKMSIRGGYSMVYDRIGGALASNASSGTLSFGLSTSLTNPAGVQTAISSPPFTGLTDLPTSLLLPSPGVKFPAQFPRGLGAGGFAITAGIDDKLKTPYSQTINFSISRELPGNFVIEASYVGRLGRNILINDDLAMPLNLVDPASKMDYFTAASMLAKLDLAKTPVSQVPKIAFWENLFPGYAGGGLTATQAIFQDYYSRSTGFGPDYTTSLFELDVDCDPCSKFGPFAFFNSQFSNLNGLRSLMPTNYHAFQLVGRRQISRGLQLMANYTWSKSIDLASTLERNGLFSGSILKSWSPTARKAVSDFDMTHQFNMSGLWEIPMGKQRKFFSSSPKWADAIIGGWQ